MREALDEHRRVEDERDIEFELAKREHLKDQEKLQEQEMKLANAITEAAATQVSLSLFSFFYLCLFLFVVRLLTSARVCLIFNDVIIFSYICTQK